MVRIFTFLSFSSSIRFCLTNSAQHIMAMQLAKGSGKLSGKLSPVKTFIADLPKHFIPQPYCSPSAAGSTAKRLVIVGDVHGARKSLETLLEKVEFERAKGDHLIFVGDLVNKGPDTPGVIDLAIKLGASAVRGNHDNAVLLAASAIEAAKVESLTVEVASGEPSLSEKPDNDEGHAEPSEDQDSEKRKENALEVKPPSTSAITAATLSSHHIDWLASLPLMLRIGLPPRPESSLGNVVIVHAGLVPGISLEQQDPYAIMHLRSLIQSGDAFVPEEAAGEEGWAAEWDRSQEKLGEGETPTTVIFGHDAKRRLQLGKYIFGLDSACVYGNQLSALIIETTATGIQHRIVQVQCADPAVTPKMKKDTVGDSSQAKTLGAGDKPKTGE
ncbi:aflYe/ orf/ Ser-Thr protein phosphatase family protein [Dactylonectria macrodidyma]|uniref:AflYe/ orf/ Ser-Thr protein phosphatase family protein n=1 Tax=Dactylonectria macrodidyma TaxID=307937 RepID=A0A9P9E129_9HYPO|nr:aflYe/ orf/ Ser-Thr protein phosphatase family protein [Dactylonectria macrodidyma]